MTDENIPGLIQQAIAKHADAVIPPPGFPAVRATFAEAKAFVERRMAELDEMGAVIERLGVTRNGSAVVGWFTTLGPDDRETVCSTACAVRGYVAAPIQ